MFSFRGSALIAVLALVGSIAAFATGYPVLGVVGFPVILVFGLVAFLQWADMTNV